MVSKDAYIYGGKVTPSKKHSITYKQGNSYEQQMKPHYGIGYFFTYVLMQITSYLVMHICGQYLISFQNNIQRKC